VCGRSEHDPRHPRLPRPRARRDRPGHRSDSAPVGQRQLSYDVAVTYPLPNGKARRINAIAGTSYRVGESIEVLHADNPTEARVRGIGTTFGTPLIMAVAGLVWASFAALILTIIIRS
jgi:hypothetical protein